MSASLGLAAGIGNGQFVWEELFLAAPGPSWTLFDQTGMG